MAFSLSPGVNVTEIDLTTVIPRVATTNGGLVGDFRWGPIEEIVLVSSEDKLARYFGRPDTDNAAVWFTAASFLAYGDKLRLVRAANEADTLNACKTAGDAVLVKNDVVFEQMLANGDFTAIDSQTCAKYAGVLGNSLKVSICGSSKAYSQSITGVSSTGTALTKTGGAFLTQLAPGSTIVASTGVRRTVVSVTSDAAAVLDEAFSPNLSNETVTADWEYKAYFGIAPDTSDYVSGKGGANDEVHVVVVDKDGVFTGLPGQVLEKYSHLSKASDAKTYDGATAYYQSAINNKSSYVKIINNPAGGDFGSPSNTTFSQNIPPYTELLEGGANGTAASDDDLVRGYDLFLNAETVDISLLMIGDASTTVAIYVISNICEVRKDCIALASPQMDSVVNVALIDQASNVIADREAIGMSTSYAVMDNNWKYMFDKYNDTYRWVPLNGDIAGLCARTDTEREPWWSPAGLNRGQIKNVIKLAYNADKADRDDLYQKGVNAVVSFAGQGTVLYGDKTLLAKPSAFDRINVRRLFIVLEKAISIAARYSLFEFNDEFTRAQFKNLVEPYLRDVKAGRGIYDFRVVCDETNNTGEVIDRNEFVGDIYIKPARSINFIQLNFIAVRTGVAFEEVVGKW